jgi:hypothetical protein
VEILMLKTLVIVGTLLMFAAPVYAGSYAAAPAADQTAKRPATSTSSSDDGRTLSDYNIQKE